MRVSGPDGLVRPVSEPQASFAVEYPCDRSCRVEVDLADTHSRFTLRQMRAEADLEHGRRHEPPTGQTPIHDDLRASFRSPSL